MRKQNNKQILNGYNYNGHNCTRKTLMIRKTSNLNNYLIPQT